MNTGELRKRVSEIQWFHTIDLGNGVVTPGVDNTPRKLAKIRMPNDLSGQTVLDIGAWDGFFAFEAERRGARRVLATDSFCWSGQAWGTRRGFELARQALDSQVEDKLIDVMDLSPAAVGLFDLVLFLGVLYHLRHPLLALEKVSSVTGRHLIVETEVDMIGIHPPAMRFYAGRELNDDPTNWWAPNPPALYAMLQDVGFLQLEVVSPPKPLAYRIARSVKQWLTQGKNPFVEYKRDRIVVHAWK
jgi:tRNA (mo5U34)-methyltransferase